MTIHKTTLLTGLLLFCIVTLRPAQQPLVEPYLISGKLAEGQSALEKHLATNPTDDQARFGLGLLRFMQAVEHLGQSWYRYGINDNLSGMAFARMPVAENPNPQQVNLYKVFYEPADFDVILWVHGSAAVPYLENGDVSSPETWGRYQRVYNGQFFSFAAWFN